MEFPQAVSLSDRQSGRLNYLVFRVLSSQEFYDTTESIGHTLDSVKCVTYLDKTSQPFLLYPIANLEKLGLWSIFCQPSRSKENHQAEDRSIRKACSSLQHLAGSKDR